MQPNNDNQQWQQPARPAVYSAEPQPVQAPVVTMAPDQQVAPTPWVAPEPRPAVPPQDAPALPPPPIDESLVRWQATEYIHRQKGAMWYLVFALIVIGFMAAAIFLIKEWTFAVLVPVMALALLVYSRRLPRMIDYTLSRQGLHINERLYPFVDFKGFGVIHDEEEYSVMLIPVKRFKPGVSVYFPEESGEAIVDMLGARLPMQDLNSDWVDRIIRKLRI